MKIKSILRIIFPWKTFKGCKRHPFKKRRSNTKKLWMRLGVTMPITAEEEAAIFCGDDKTSEAALRKIIAEGRFVPDGDSYIPGPAIENFNRDYGTNYEPGDLNMDY